MVEHKDDVLAIVDLEAIYAKNVKTRDEIYKAIANRKDGNV